MRLGILTGGGDRPGLNAVFRVAVTRTPRTDQGLSPCSGDALRARPTDLAPRQPLDPGARDRGGRRGAVRFRGTHGGSVPAHPRAASPCKPAAAGHLTGSRSASVRAGHPDRITAGSHMNLRDREAASHKGE